MPPYTKGVNTSRCCPAAQTSPRSRTAAPGTQAGLGSHKLCLQPLC